MLHIILFIFFLLSASIARSEALVNCRSLLTDEYPVYLIAVEEDYAGYYQIDIHKWESANKSKSIYRLATGYVDGWGGDLQFSDGMFQFRYYEKGFLHFIGQDQAAVYCGPPLNAPSTHETLPL